MTVHPPDLPHVCLCNDQYSYRSLTRARQLQLMRAGSIAGKKASGRLEHETQGGPTSLPGDHLDPLGP